MMKAPATHHPSCVGLRLAQTTTNRLCEAIDCILFQQEQIFAGRFLIFPGAEKNVFFKTNLPLVRVVLSSGGLERIPCADWYRHRCSHFRQLSFGSSIVWGKRNDAVQVCHSFFKSLEVAENVRTVA